MKILHVGFGFRPWRVGGLIAYAEDVMERQAEQGHDVAYFFRGRHYPGLRDDRLGRWHRRGVRMREVLNSSLATAGEGGTLTPEADLQHTPSERHFVRVLDELHPDVVHVQEVLGLPTSLIDLAQGRGIPVVATLQDYFPLCPVLKLYDVDGQLCIRHDVGAQCVRCSARAPNHRRVDRYMTIQHALAGWVGFERAERSLGGLKAAKGRLLRPRTVPPSSHSSPARTESPRDRTPSAASYQARREANVDRLSRLDAVVAQSRRLGEIYAQLGVDASRITVMQLTLGHLELLTPRRIPEPPARVRFVTLNGAVSVPKGSELLVETLSQLDAAGLGHDFTLTVLGDVAEGVAGRLSRFQAVELGGRYDTSELDARLGEHHVGVIPSVWEEAYGYVGLELLAKGIPVLGNALGGIVDYVRDGETGWLNRDVSATGLAATMARIIEHPVEICERNRWILAHRNELIRPLADHVSELQALYQRILGRGCPE